MKKTNKSKNLSLRSAKQNRERLLQLEELEMVAGGATAAVSSFGGSDIATMCW